MLTLCTICEIYGSNLVAHYSKWFGSGLESKPHKGDGNSPVELAGTQLCASMDNIY